jgi:hypothetical protein
MAYTDVLGYVAVTALTFTFVVVLILGTLALVRWYRRT